MLETFNLTIKFCQSNSLVLENIFKGIPYSVMVMSLSGTLLAGVKACLELSNIALCVIWVNQTISDTIS